jgi:hypothetical protein
LNRLRDLAATQPHPTRQIDVCRGRFAFRSA